MESRVCMKSAWVESCPRQSFSSCTTAKLHMLLQIIYIYMYTPLSHSAAVPTDSARPSKLSPCNTCHKVATNLI